MKCKICKDEVKKESLSFHNRKCGICAICGLAISFLTELHTPDCTCGGLCPRGQMEGWCIMEEIFHPEDNTTISRMKQSFNNLESGIWRIPLSYKMYDYTWRVLWRIVPLWLKRRL